MNCERFEKLIASHVEGDLAGRRAERVREHLGSCLDCREFAEQLKASQAALKSLGQESLDETMFREVRASVLARIASAGERRRFVGWQYALAGGLILILIFAVTALFRRRPPKGHVEEVTASHQEQTEIPAGTHATELPSRPTAPSRRAGPMPPRRRQVETVQTARVKPARPEQLTIKLVTDDPNVVIYWLVD